MAKVLTTVNYKGGVGKTMITFNVANKMANEVAGRILVIDNDPQATLSYFYVKTEDLNENNSLFAIYENPESAKIDKVIHKTINRNIDIIPNINQTALLDLAGIGTVFTLQNFIEQIKEEYELIIIDNSPYINRFTQNSLNVANYVIVPITPTIESVRGMESMLDIILSFQKIRSDLAFIGFVINMKQDRTTAQKEIRKQLYSVYGDKIMASEIHLSTEFHKSAIDKTPVKRTGRSGRAGNEVSLLAREILFHCGYTLKYPVNIERIRAENVKYVMGK